jgi:hypothetical protein
VNRFDTIFMQRTRKGRNGRIAMRHTTKTTNIRPSIPRMRKKRKGFRGNYISIEERVGE